MTTPTPLTQQRQLVRDFLTADQRRRQREAAAQQQYTAGEKAANEQHASTERAAQQSYTAAIKTQEDTQRAQKSQIDQAVDTIDAARRDAREYLRILDTPLSELPPALEDSTPQSPTVRDGEPVAALTAGAGRIRQLGINAGQLLEAKNRQRARQEKQVIGAAVAVVILVTAGYFFFQRWSYDQTLSALYQAGVTALNNQEYSAARSQFSELLSKQPDYRDAQALLHETYYRAGLAALEAGDWDTAQDNLTSLLNLQPNYQDAQALLHETYYRAGLAAVEAGNWEVARSQLSALLAWQPDNPKAITLVNQHAQEIGLAINPTDGAAYVPVPAGEFLMGSSEGVGDDDEHPQHAVYLDAFWIMQTEVTNAQYAQCVAAGACSAPDNSRWQDPAYGQHPVTDVDWNQANTYAQWVGGRLPTEAEWEKAARGTDGRTYPWGNEQPDQSLANCCGFVNDTTPVGSYPAGASPYGVLDMAGNVWEWTADWYGSGYYSQSPAQNPTGPNGGQYRVLRGGAYYAGAEVVRVAYRLWVSPVDRLRIFGFRVASSSPGF